MKSVIRNRFLVIALLVVLGGGFATAQFTNFFWNGHQDFPLPDSACYSGTTVVHAAPFTYNDNLWVLYTCSDNRVWARRFVDTSATESSSVPPPTTSSCTTVNPGPAFTCVDGNWIYTG